MVKVMGGAWCVIDRWADGASWLVRAPRAQRASGSVADSHKCGGMENEQRPSLNLTHHTPRNI